MAIENTKTNSKLKQLNTSIKKTCNKCPVNFNLSLVTLALCYLLASQNISSQSIGPIKLVEAGEVVPAAESLDDDDDEDDELDASATGEYPEEENNDESYDDGDYPTSQETNQRQVWTRNRQRFGQSASGARFKRRAPTGSGSGSGGENDFNVDFAIDDGDEDAWVHDGIDDIHIDPETKRAASELNHDERSIDAEYEPNQSEPNRTRVSTTTITEVIPVEERLGAEAAPAAAEVRYLPAAYISLDAARRLVQQSEGNERLAR